MKSAKKMTKRMQTEIIKEEKLKMENLRKKKNISNKKKEVEGDEDAL